MLAAIAKSFLLPPGINFVLIITGLISSRRWHKFGLIVFWFGIISLYLLTTPIVSNALLASLEHDRVLNLNKLKNNPAKAIVILTSGSVYAPEFGGSAPSATSLQRAYYAALLYKSVKLPILISGGMVSGETTPESTEMKRLLQQGFNVPVWQIEPRSHNTYQNAQSSAEILKANHIKYFYLVTSAWHMPRALWSFQKFGLDPIAAPTDYSTDKISNSLTAWFPNPRALSHTYLALHEYLGLFWYQHHYKKHHG